LIVGQDGERPQTSIQPFFFDDYVKAMGVFLPQADRTRREVQP
jgi:hypothetical protein